MKLIVRLDGFDRSLMPGASLLCFCCAWTFVAVLPFLCLLSSKTKSEIALRPPSHGTGNFFLFFLILRVWSLSLSTWPERCFSARVVFVDFPTGFEIFAASFCLFPEEIGQPLRALVFNLCVRSASTILLFFPFLVRGSRHVLRPR